MVALAGLSSNTPKKSSSSVGAKREDTPMGATAPITYLQHTFSLIRSTEDMHTTARLVAYVFPWLSWLAEHWEVPTLGSDRSNETSSSLHACPVPHMNALPSNNRYGPSSTDQLPLLEVPDFSTEQAIQQHNALDLRLYRALQRQFARQNRVLGLE
jgi:hypothetical protein